MKQEYITPTTQIVQSLIDTSLMNEEGWALAGSGTHSEAGSGPGPAPTHSM